MCNLNLAGTTYTQAVIAPDTNNTTSDFQGTQFTGVFDGNSHTISYLTITTPTKDFIGLFGYVGSGGQIKNLGSENVSLTGRYAVGGLVGLNNNGSIINCYSTGTISGYFYVGGLVGENAFASATLTSCYATVSVSGNTHVGGLVGFNYQGLLTSCHATSSVSATGDRIGGLAGSDSSGRIVSCYSTGTISSPGGDNLGGLVGFSSGTIERCWSSCSLWCSYSGSSYSFGGLVGYFTTGVIRNSFATGEVGSDNFMNWHSGGLAGTFKDGTIIDCYSTGRVKGVYNVGGFIGMQEGGDVTNSYSTGYVNGLNACEGGFIGVKSGGTVTNCFWDKYTSNLYVSAGGMGKTTAEMKTLLTLTDAGWDFVGETTNGTNDTWRMCVNGVNYPKLTWQHVQVGDFACPDGVKLDDFARLSQDWMTTYSLSLYGADADGDKTVDLDDLAILAVHWLEGI
jgi:hypothetical protein